MGKKLKKKRDYTWVDEFRREHIKKSTKNPGLSALMSFFVMGLGQIYSGHIDKGMFLITFQILAVCMGYSLYSEGIIYKWIYSLTSPNFVVVISFILSLIYILTWIYNVKEAYYLAIFSSFRDWFEVEKVLLPSIGISGEKLISNRLLTPRYNVEEVKSLEDKTEGSTPLICSSEEKELENEDNCIEIEGNKSLKEEKKGCDFMYSSAINLVYMKSNTWKIYWLLTSIVVCASIGVGLYLQYNNEETYLQISKEFDVNSNKTEIANNNVKAASKLDIQEKKEIRNSSSSANLEPDSLIPLQVQAKIINNNIKNGSNKYVTLTDNTPVIYSADVVKPDLKTNIKEELKTDDKPETKISENKVVVIQGNKETIIEKKNVEKSSVAKKNNETNPNGVILYEVPDNHDDDVQLVMADDGGLDLLEASIKKNTKKNDEINKKIDNKSSSSSLAMEKLVENDNLEKDTISKENDNNKSKVDDSKGKEELIANTNLNLNNKSDTVKVNQISESIELKSKLDSIKEKGGAEFYNGNWEAALPYYLELLKYRKNSETFEMVGIVFEKMNKLPEAFDAYENAYLLGLETSSNLTRLGLIGEKIGNYEKAQRYLEKAIEKNPKRADIILSYARCLHKQGEDDAASQVLEVLKESTNSYAIKKAVELEYNRISKLEALKKKKKNDQKELDSLTSKIEANTEF